ncbi:ATP-binding protein [Synoicihabitans lomoniglobus]|uniref:ATP-binding protein n=1 Tax=Synoicihabitans lomoniglobus TaxID=2909285 RepID=A0AAE9ZVS7_9BACT|nr:putative DNA binding domain-containing protein [Opitutaceae bacterium LMO-M01]WED65101.1 ATP-binding protein [Opitutaceae bacterium LMO-M01]
MPTSSSQFEQWLDAPEGTNIEFKSAAGGYHFDRLLQYCVALANEGGGQIIFGVTDRRPRSVSGTQAFAEPGRTEEGLYQRLHHRIPVEEYYHGSTRTVIVHVPGRLPGTAWSIDGRYLKRAGDGLVGMPDTELRAIFSETGPDFTATPCPADISVLNPDLVATFRERWAVKSGNPRLRQLSDAALLQDAELLVDDRPCYAALLLMGTREALSQFLPQAEVVFEYRSSEASGPAQDREEFRTGFLGFQDALWKKINLRNDRQSYQDDFFRYDIPTFDEVAIREAILNAVAHRDYRFGGSIFIRQYARRLEIVSPGGLPLGITPDNIADQQNPRNRRLAEALQRIGFVERAGQGMNLMIENAIRQTKPLPSFAGSADHEVQLTLAGTVQNPAFIRYLERLGDDRLSTFSTYDYLTLDALQRDVPQPLEERMSARLPSLLEIGAVERMGRGKGTRYLLSRELFAAMGKSGAYTRQRGLDHETNKALLMKHLWDHATTGAPKRDLVQVLPSVSASSLHRLLEELRDSGFAELRGERRWARWFPLKPYVPN